MKTNVAVALSEGLLAQYRVIADLDGLKITSVIRLALERYVEQRRSEPAIVAATNAMEQRQRELFEQVLSRSASEQGKYNLADMLITELEIEREAAVSAYTRWRQAILTQEAAYQSLHAAIDSYNRRRIERYRRRLSYAGLALCWRCRQVLPSIMVEPFAGAYRKYKGGADCEWFIHWHIYQACQACHQQIIESIVSPDCEQDGYIELFSTRMEGDVLQAQIDGDWLSIKPWPHTAEGAYHLALQHPVAWKEWNAGGPLALHENSLYLGDCRLLP